MAERTNAAPGSTSSAGTGEDAVASDVAIEDPAHNEFALIDRILERLGDAVASEILLPPGDDAAAWVPAGGAVIATADAMTEGSHWLPHLLSMYDVGWRCVAANVSDLAAMGATPQVLLVTAVLGPTMTIDDLDAFIDGLADGCRAHGVQIAGGDVVRGRSTTFSITALGAARLDRANRAIVLRRDGAHPGDVIAVSGTPGLAAAGMRLVEQARTDPPADAAIAAFRHPVGRVDLGLAAVAVGVPCAIDISDGLIQDLGHIAQRSGVGIEIDLEALPLPQAAVAFFGTEGARTLALAGGEDFELILVARQNVIESLEAEDLTIIGRVLEQHPGEVVIRQADGAPYPVPQGWDALRRWPLPRLQ